VVDVRGGELDIGRRFHYRYASLRFLDTPGKTQWTFLHPREHDLWIGHQADVSIRRGFLSLPWISAVRRDDEKRLRSILAGTPTAARPWEDLITLYLDTHRWSEARQATADFLKIYPKKIRYVHYAATVLLNARRFDDMVALLEPLAQKRADYQMYSLLGFALAMTGRKTEGVELLNKAIRLDPDNYWAYYSLGYAHLFTGDPRAAVPHFEKVLQIRPDYPEIEDQLRTIRESAVNPSPSQKQ
jgi:tetratricopeptide (TPR) repeat protein